MNYAPAVKQRRPRPLARRRADVPHAGQWEFVFELRAGGKTDRLARLSASQVIHRAKRQRRSCSTARGRRRRARSEQPRVRQARGDRARREAVLRAAASRRPARCCARLATQPYRAFQDGAAARLRPAGSRSQHADACSTALLALVRLGRRDTTACGRRHPAAARRARDGRHARRTWPGSSRDDVSPADYASAFGIARFQQKTRQVLVDAGKALAAFQETLVSGRTPFDEFRDALARSESDARRLSGGRAARLEIFIGKGNCSTCHFGPHFTNGEFARHRRAASSSRRGASTPGGSDGIKQAEGQPLQPARPVQ